MGAGGPSSPAAKGGQPRHLKGEGALGKSGLPLQNYPYPERIFSKGKRIGIGSVEIR